MVSFILSLVIMQVSEHKSMYNAVAALRGLVKPIKLMKPCKFVERALFPSRTCDIALMVHEHVLNSIPPHTMNICSWSALTIWWLTPFISTHSCCQTLGGG